jgi:polar amino acid transport system substrate-binding protein
VSSTISGNGSSDFKSDRKSDLQAVTASSLSSASKELASTGNIRIGVVFAPAVSTFFVVKDDQGRPHGVTVDLGNALAATLGTSAEFFVVPNSGELTDAVEKELIDVAFMPVDEERRKRVEFGPNYFMLEATGLVRGDSGIASISDLDRPEVKVVGIANTTTIRGTARALPSATIVSSTSVGEAMDMLRDGRADAVSLSRDVLLTYQQKIPGSRLLDGHLHSAGIAIAVPKGKPAALDYVSAFLEDAKASGLVRRIFDNAGLYADAVAPGLTPE